MSTAPKETLFCSAISLPASNSLSAPNVMRISDTATGAASAHSKSSSASLPCSGTWNAIDVVLSPSKSVSTSPYELPTPLPAVEQAMLSSAKKSW